MTVNNESPDKEKSVSINLTITAENADHLLREIGVLARFLEQRTGAPAPTAEEPEARPARRGRKAAGPIIEGTVNKGDEGDVRTGSGADEDVVGVSDDAGAEVADGAGEVASGTVDQAAGTPAGDDAPSAEAAAEQPAPVDPDEIAPKEVTDELRAYVIDNYLNAYFPTPKPGEKDSPLSLAFKALLDEFGVDKLKALKVSQVARFRAVVDAKIAEKKGGAK